jgi:uncharacterized protein
MPMTAAPPTDSELPDFVAAKLPEIAALCRECGGRRLDLFGSAATGRFDPDRSDLDFLVEFGELPTRGFSSPYFRLREALGALFERKVDLVSDRSLENPYRRRRIESERRTLFLAPT